MPSRRRPHHTLGHKPWCEAWLHAQGLQPQWSLCHQPWAITLHAGGQSGQGATWLEATRQLAQRLGLPLEALPAEVQVICDDTPTRGQPL
jgi:hypothetical protein